MAIKLSSSNTCSTNSRSYEDSASLTLVSRMNALWHRFETWLFTETDTRHWAFFRIGAALVTLSLFLTVRPDLLDLYGKYGYIQSDLIDTALPTYQLRLHYLMSWLGIADAQEIVFLNGVYWTYIGTLICLLLGFLTRLAAAMSLFFQLLFIGSGIAYNYGGDWFIASSFFYCLLFPVGSRYAVDGFLFKNHASNFRLYNLVLQGHLCMVYLFAGFSKSLGTTWWNGEAIWRSVMAIDFRMFDVSILAHYPMLLTALGVSVLILELGYPLFVSMPKTRRLCLFATVGMHIGIAIFMKLWFFAAILCVWNIAAWGFRVMKTE